jgi:hypothetical protein
MWGTCILEAYCNHERERVAEALEDICSPRDDYGFASGGVYCFWALDTRRPLYIGRAVDLPDRFRQHNGLGGRRTRGTKLAHIDNHFGDDKYKPLGYSILVRSPASQTTTGRRRRDLTKLYGWVEDPGSIQSENEYEIAQVEGTAIRSYWLAHGKLPPWNAIQGQATRWSTSMRRPDMSAELFCGTVNSLIQARRTIVPLAQEPTSVAYETDLHTARIEAVKRTMFENRQLCDRDILRQLDEILPWWGLTRVEHIREEEYLLKYPWLMSARPGPLSMAQRLAWTHREPVPASPPAPPLREDDELPFL